MDLIPQSDTIGLNPLMVDTCMKRLNFSRIVVSGLVLLCQLAMASEPADGNIRDALADIQRFEQQVGTGSVSRNTANRTLKLLNLTRQRLDASGNREDPSWIEADTRLTALVARLSGDSTASSQTAPPTRAAPQVSTPQPTAPARPAATSSAPQMISQDVARLKKLLRDINSATETIDQAGVRPFQDPEVVARYQASADRSREMLARYDAFAEHPDVQTITEALAVMDRMIAFGQSEAARTLAELGDVQARLAAIHQQVRDNALPDLPEPLTGEALVAWIDGTRQIKANSAALDAELRMLAERAYLPETRGTVEQGAAYDMQNVNSLLHSIDRNLRRIDESLEQMAMNQDAQAAHVVTSLEYVENLDPATWKDQANAYLRDGAVEEITARIDKQIATIETAIAFDQAMGRESLGQWQSLMARAVSTRLAYLAGRQQALKLVRMPEEVDYDEDLDDIAEDVLSKAEYEVGEWERLVVNADLSHHETESSEVEFDKVDVRASGDIKLSGTQTTTFYEWDEFQVATAEPVGDRYFVFYNTLRHFTRGASTTPLNRWILSSRSQSVEIPKDNIDLD